MKAVEIEGLSHQYPSESEERSLNNVSLSIRSGTRVALLGANGSGKTTLLHHLNGLLLPQTGSVRVMGTEVCKRSLAEVRQNVGLVFDHPDNQLFATDVYHDVAFGPQNMGLEPDAVHQRVMDSLAFVDMVGFLTVPPYNLSLGQKKKVAIAGVLAMDTPILVLDEPFSGLDPLSSRQTLKILDDLAGEGKTLIMSTHDVDVAFAWADEVVIVRQGELIRQGGIELLVDEELMQRCSLCLPILAQAFRGFERFPRTGQEANELLVQMIGKKL